MNIFLFSVENLLNLIFPLELTIYDTERTPRLLPELVNLLEIATVIDVNRRPCTSQTACCHSSTAGKTRVSSPLATSPVRLPQHTHHHSTRCLHYAREHVAAPCTTSAQPRPSQALLTVPSLAHDKVNPLERQPSFTTTVKLHPEQMIAKITLRTPAFLQDLHDCLIPNIAFYQVADLIFP